MPPALSPDKQIATIVLFPKTGPAGRGDDALLERLRGDILPPVERQTGTSVYVGGQVASQEDFADVIAGKLPLFVGSIVLLSALLLMIMFRSIFIPIKAALLNLLSIGAALGFVTLVFQDGFLAELLSSGTGPVESFVPVMVFAIVFGLSMDYEVFLVSRMHEEWLRTGDASRSVRNGLATTGRVVTAAATIMIVVFLTFALGPDRIIKEFGIGLAAADLPRRVRHPHPARAGAHAARRRAGVVAAGRPRAPAAAGRARARVARPSTDPAPAGAGAGGPNACGLAR